MGSEVEQVTQKRHYSLSGSDRILGKNAKETEFLHFNRTDYKLELRIERQSSEDTIWLAAIKVSCAPTWREEGSSVAQYRGTKICRRQDDGWKKHRIKRSHKYDEGNRRSSIVQVHVRVSLPSGKEFLLHMARFKPTSNLFMMMDMLTEITEAQISLCVTAREDTAPLILNICYG